MKGIKIERALPSNQIDVYALLKEFYAEEGGANKPYPKINPRNINEHIRNWLIGCFADRHQIFYLARRGKTYIGFIHAHILPRPPIGWSMFVYTCFVQKNKRKLGIAKSLADAIEVEAEKLGIGVIELMCKTELTPKWEKLGAKKVYDYLVKEL